MGISRFNRLLGIHLLPGVAYYIVAKLSILLLAIPPSEASAVWPAAGISICAIMLGGRRVCYGLFVALFVLYCESWLDLSSISDGIRSLVLILLLCAAALVQAVWAVTLLDRILGLNDPLIEDKRIVYFLLIIGPVASLAGATIAITSLALFGIVSGMNEFLVSWSTWWIGDSIGAMVVTPLLLTFLACSNKALSSRRLTVGLPLLGMLVVIFSLFFMTLANEDSNRKQAFSQQAQELHTHVEKRLQANFEVLYSIRSFFNANDQVNGAEFSRFSRHQLARYPEIQALEWIPRVRNDERLRFEASDDGPGKITQLSAGGEVVEAEQREEYFPVMYLEPVQGNERAYGFDISTNVVAREAQKLTLAKGELALTAPVRLVQEQGEQSGVVAYLRCAHQHATDSIFQYGVIAGVFRIDDFVSSVMKLREDISSNISLQIDDISSDPITLYRDEYDLLNSKSALQELYWQSEVALGGRIYRFSYRPQPGFLVDLVQWSSWVVLIAGLLFTSLLGGWLLSLTGGTMRIGQVVRERTFNLQHEIEERKKAERELRKLSKAVEFSPYMVLITKPDGEIEYVSPKFSEITEFEASEVIGSNIESLHFEKKGELSYRDVWTTLLDEPDWHGEIINQKRNGSLYWAQVHIAPIYDTEALLTHFVVTLQDITEARLISEQISYQASHDQLTGLVNRREFEVRLEHLLKIGAQSDAKHAFCFLDLDQFKVVNDTCGHIAGDELLRQISAILQDRIRATDTLARLGGDEFGILMQNCPLYKAEMIAEDIRDAIAQFKFGWENQVFSIGASIGVVQIDDNSASMTEVLQQADSACYTAKDSGRNRVHLYQSGDELLAQREGEMHWVSEINAALEDNRFLLYGQLIKPLQNSQLKPDVELLIRMRDSEGNIIPPGAFLPAAERYQLSSRIDRWVVDNAFDWLEKNFDDFSRCLGCCAINLSGGSLGDSDIKNNIINHLEGASNLPYKVKFEVTETSAIANLSEARRFINALKAYGCQFSLDDFGSGLSSFAYLKNLPVDNLKIDGLFVKGIAEDKLDLAMVKSINDIGHVMGKTTIAEFVENDEIRDILQQIGVDYGQGYGLGRPIPLDQLLEELLESESNSKLISDPQS